MIWGAIIGAGASLIGGMMANKDKQGSADSANEFSERMSSTSYQRGMEDMRLAGLNPMLAYKQGGASSPTGAMAQPQDVVSPAVATAQAGLNLSSNLKTQRVQRSQTKAMTQATYQNAINTHYDTQVKKANFTTEIEKAKKIREEAKQTQAVTAGIHAENFRKVAEAKLYSGDHAEALAGLEKALTILGGFTGAVSNLKR